MYNCPFHDTNWYICDAIIYGFHIGSVNDYSQKIYEAQLGEFAYGCAGVLNEVSVRQAERTNHLQFDALINYRIGTVQAMVTESADSVGNYKYFSSSMGFGLASDNLSFEWWD